MSVLSRTLKGVISEYVTGSLGTTSPPCICSMGPGLEVPVLSLLSVQGPAIGQEWEGRVQQF